MNKKELTVAVAQKAGITQKDTERVINCLCQTIIDNLSSQQKVQLVGFGSFVIRQRAERAARNPRTGKTVSIPAARVPVFRPGKQFKEQINSKA